MQNSELKIETLRFLCVFVSPPCSVFSAACPEYASFATGLASFALASVYSVVENFTQLHSICCRGTAPDVFFHAVR